MVILTGNLKTCGNMGLRMDENKSVTSEMAVQYQQAGKSEKTVILNAFTGVTGYHRKYAIKAHIF
ncbi:hypothetical protein FACS189494_04930 [Spirochaetia bacterium]|nr:hypothetical protein FACS189494_04930 [Spirochaetia bacterium]